MLKTWTLRFRVVDRDNFLEVKKGLKTIETRAATDKYRAIKRGDIIIFVCGKSRIKRIVKSVKIFRTITSMTNTIPFRRIMPSVDSIDNMRNAYYGYPGYREKIRKYGIIAFKIAE